MRTLLALAAVALLAAGCAQTASPGGDASSSPSSAPTSGGNQGIAVGEPNPNAPGGIHGGMPIKPAHGEAAHDGLNLTGDESASGMAPGGSVTFTYVATNVGAAAVVHGACERPYAFTLRDANGKDHALHVPMAQCQGFSEDPFAANAKLEVNATWDGRYAEGETMVQAPAGAYTFTATFTAYRGEQKATVSLDLPVNIVQPGAQ